jgi:hypothetical protein
VNASAFVFHERPLATPLGSAREQRAAGTDVPRWRDPTAARFVRLEGFTPRVEVGRPARPDAVRPALRPVANSLRHAGELVRTYQWHA